MIFQKTIDLVLSGRKTQTCRLAYAGDVLIALALNPKAKPSDLIPYRVETAARRARWIVGGTYAVQAERCHPARGRILVTSLREVLDPTAVDGDFARAEGFDSVDDYLRVWHELHRKQPVQRCWAIGFALAVTALAGGREA